MVDNPDSVPTSGYKPMSALARQTRRLLLFDRAKTVMGGARLLGEAIGETRRSVNHKLAFDRPLHDADLRLTADAIEQKAAEASKLAADIREML